jgi:hypothetical protein
MNIKRFLKSTIFLLIFSISKLSSDPITVVNDSKIDIFVTVKHDGCIAHCENDNFPGKTTTYPCCIYYSHDGKTALGSANGWLINGKQNSLDPSNSKSENFTPSIFIQNKKESVRMTNAN